ncbi:17159_t:CDS:1, partial [Gigaspora rosea]
FSSAFSVHSRPAQADRKPPADQSCGDSEHNDCCKLLGMSLPFWLIAANHWP